MKPIQFALMTMIVVAVTTGVVCGANATAHEKATGVVKERMEVMKSIGKAMKGLSAMAKGEATYDAAEVKTLATTIQTKSAEVPKLFPEGSLQPVSEALPAIWQDWPKFEKLSKQLGETSGAVADAAEGGRGAMVPAFANLAKNCNACHTDFRKKKEEE